MSMIFAKPALVQLVGATTLTLSDHNRAPLSEDPEIISLSGRTARGKLKRFHVANKRTFSTSWDDLPHTAEHTVDGYAGALEIKSFVAANTGSLTLRVRKIDGTDESFTVVIESAEFERSKRWSQDYYNVRLELVEV